jgi:hypothetical protein
LFTKTGQGDSFAAYSVRLVSGIDRRGQDYGAPGACATTVDALLFPLYSRVFGTGDSLEKNKNTKSPITKTVTLEA